MDVTGAIIGNFELIGTSSRLYADSTVAFGSHVGNWENRAFFNLPATDYYWGSAVASSIYRGRFVAVLPSFDGPAAACARGWLNIAVSSSGDPRQAWTRYRVAVSDAWTDAINIGVSDDKVVLATNQWDLDVAQSDCLATTYEGARLRVLDWADLLNGGTLTVRDVTPSSPTTYYNWVPAANVPGTASTAAGTTIQLAGERSVAGVWGHFVYAAITGSAKAATAVVSRNEDLTAAGRVSQLSPPPDVIAAFTSGNGYQDERVISASWRSGRLWASTTTSCKLAEDSAFRACGRFILLDTTTTPVTVLDDASGVELERDTFLPLVGLSRDGSAYFVMSASSALSQQPIDEFATYRAPGETFSGGAPAQRIWAGDQKFTFSTYWGSRGTVIPESGDSRGVWAVYGASFDGWPFTNLNSHIKGGQAGPPAGSFVMGNGSGWSAGYDSWATLYPATDSPIQRVRWSAAPDVEETAGGPRLLLAKEAPSTSRIYNIDFEDPAIGGQLAPSPLTLWVQWQTADGIWSTPISATDQLDLIAPTVSQPRVAFNSGTVGSKVPVRVSWTASDAQSGLQSIQYSEDRLQPTRKYGLLSLAGTVTYVNRSLTVGGRYSLQVQATDRAGWNVQLDPVTRTFSAVQSSSALAYYRTWYTGYGSSYLGKSTRYATAAGATLTYKFTGRAIAFVSTKARNRGKAEVWVDGVKRATINLYSSTTKYRQIVYQTSWEASGTHTIKIKVLGTSGRPRVDFDAFMKAS